MSATLSSRTIIAVLFVISLAFASPAPHGVAKPEYIPISAAKPILDAFSWELPPDVAEAAREPAPWRALAARRDSEVRGRIARGDEDSLVNLLLYGTSFTDQPRLTAESFARVPPGEETNYLAKVLTTRAENLVSGMASATANERLRFMRSVIEQAGFSLQSAPERQAATQYLMSNLARVRREYKEYSQRIQQARQSHDPSVEFAERSHLFENRGLSLDTTLPPDFGLEQTFQQLKARHLLEAGSVRRVAVIGPGLDFVDKDEGYDFYPVQSIQPFAVIDSLKRVGLAADSLAVDTLDLSRRINQHLNSVHQRALRGGSYMLQLVRDPERKWRPELVAYWERFGTEIGHSVPPAQVPASLTSLQIRAVRVPPAVVSRVTPRDLNIVWQRYNLPPAQRYDLVIATNILVYYSPWEQSLALANIASMLKPSGLLLSNNAVPEIPATGMKSLDYTSVVYSDHAGDGDHIVWYKRVAP
jgi:hypothetical protein